MSAKAIHPSPLTFSRWPSRFVPAGMNLSIRAIGSVRFRFFPESSDKAAPALSRDLRRWVGKRVVVEGTSPFGAHTGHHHAPLLLPITRIALASVPTQSYGTAMTTVQGFYAALRPGNGEEAAKFVIPKKRSSGPLSATAISKFYGNLPEPLTLVDVVATRSGEYRVRYRYV